jgi:hypothetical protein
MNRALRNTLLLACLLLVPFALGALVIGPTPPAGRTSRSASRVGHQAMYALIERLGFRVRRFERGLETLARERGVLIALEPGPMLFRDGGRWARPLLDWVADGNTALITLGPDPDRAAELDDRADLIGDTAQRVIDAVREVEQRSLERSATATATATAVAMAETATPAPNIRAPKMDPERRRRVGRQDDASSSWSSRHLAELLALPLAEARLEDTTPETPCALTGTLSTALGEGQALQARLTRPRVWADHHSAEVGRLLSLCGAPLVLELWHGRGLIILVSEPRLFQNARIGEIGHARLAVRLAERLTAAAGTDVVYFEEFSHGGREIENVVEAAWLTSARRPTIQLLLVALLWLLASAGRRRSPLPFEAPSRRSRAEVIDAMATLHARSGDVSGAAERLVEMTRVRIAAALGLRGEDARATQLMAAALSRRDTATRTASAIERLLDPRTVRSTADLLARARDLRDLRLEAARRPLTRHPIERF